VKTAIAALAAALTLSVLAGEARANGRFPQADHIIFAPSDPDLIFLRATFGLLVSRDRGAHWDWVCEGAIGFSGVEDPMYAITPNGTTLGTTFLGLTISPDRACSWSFAGGDLHQLVFIDLTQRPDRPESVVTFASSYQGQDGDGGIFFTSQLFETTDEGRTFQAMGPPLDDALLGETVEVTATDPDRLYVTATRSPGLKSEALLLTSRDRGKTWEESLFPLVGTERTIYIAAVDPTNADRVYVRTSNRIGMPTRLLVTDDAGASFRPIFEAPAGLPGFAISPDGKKLFVGGPRYAANTPPVGLFAADTDTFTFEKRSDIAVQCLALSSDGLWACSDSLSGFIAGLSNDEGRTFDSKLGFCDIRGPMACPEGTSTHAQCEVGGVGDPPTAPWEIQKELLGCGTDTRDAGAGDGGLDGGAGEGGDPGGCSCRAASASPWSALVAGVGALLALARRRGRKHTEDGSRRPLP
jgi:hypothetical protein